VGRLDQDSSGLLLMTNDTAFAELIMNPENEVPKTYLVKAATLLTDEHLEMLRRGVELDDGPTKPAEVRRVRDSEKRTFIEMTIREGRYREVRRMLEAVGSRALKLVRTAVGPLAIGALEIGKYRELTPEEVRSLAPRSGPDRRRAR
jgi:23S rRNA pseudouridine2605 synthase